jgi:hypothetical protein
MRWQPESDRCVECGFDWGCDIEVAIQQVERVDAALPQIADFERWTSRPGAGVWSPSEYVWHLVDGLRIGAERLWLVSTDPEAPIICWDENVLASARQYGRLSPAVGRVALQSGRDVWLTAARSVPHDVEVTHDALGTMTAVDVARRTAHEVEHHLLDIDRGLGRA